MNIGKVVDEDLGAIKITSARIGHEITYFIGCRQEIENYRKTLERLNLGFDHKIGYCDLGEVEREFCYSDPEKCKQIETEIREIGEFIRHAHSPVQKGNEIIGLKRKLTPRLFIIGRFDGCERYESLNKARDKLFRLYQTEIGFNIREIEHMRNDLIGSSSEDNISPHKHRSHPRISMN